MARKAQYAKRVAISLQEIVEDEFGEKPPLPRVLEIVRSHLDDKGRPAKREEFAAWVFERDREALRP